MSSFRDYKVVLLGPIAVGKTSIINRFCSGDFIAKTKSTVGAGFYSKQITHGNTEVTLMIWDTAGDERFKAVTPSLLHGANGFALVYDVTSAESFKQLHSYLLMINEHTKDTGSVPILVLGNKCDMPEKLVTKETISGWMEENNLELFEEVSAKTGANIEESFDKLVDALLNVRIEQIPKPISITIDPTSKTEQPTESKKCC